MEIEIPFYDEISELTEGQYNYIKNRIKEKEVSILNRILSPTPNQTEVRRIKGEIIKLNTTDGWGFITSNDPEFKFIRIFFHWSALPNLINIKDLKKFQKVEFEPKQFEGKGWRAIKITLV